jgi:hypothetical protein
MTHSEMVLEFFTANPGKNAREMGLLLGRECFGSDSEHLSFAKHAGSLAHKLWVMGELARESKLDPVTGKEVWHYTQNTALVPLAVQGQRRSALAAELETVRAERDALRAELQSLLELLDSATLPQVG